MFLVYYSHFFKMIFLFYLIIVNLIYIKCFLEICFAMLFKSGSSHFDTAVWIHYFDANKTAGEEARWQLHKNIASNIE